MVKIEESSEGNGGGREALPNPHHHYYNTGKSSYPPPSIPSHPSSSSSNYPQSRRTQYQSPPTHPLSPLPPDSPCSSTYESLHDGPSPQHEPNLFLPPPNPPHPQSSTQTQQQSRAVFNLLIRNESLPVATTMTAAAGDEDGSTSSRGRGVRGDGRGIVLQQQQPQGGVRRRSVSAGGREHVARKAAVVFRVFGLLVCLISFSVMVSDKNRGWALDSFDRYKEFRYSAAVNAIGFAYSVLQMITLFTTKNGKNKTQFLYYLDFVLDQMLAYLLVSASSSAATRVDDWIMNWGKDEFPMRASVSVATSFLGFLTFALSSLSSGYLLYCRVHA